MVQELLCSTGTLVEGALDHTTLGVDARKRIRTRYLSSDDNRARSRDPSPMRASRSAQIREERAAAVVASRERSRRVLRKLDDYKETDEYKQKVKWGQIGPAGNFVSLALIRRA